MEARVLTSFRCDEWHGPFSNPVPMPFSVSFHSQQTARHFVFVSVFCFIMNGILLILVIKNDTQHCHPKEKSVRIKYVYGRLSNGNGIVKKT
jgi:hypothetical protein